MRRLCLAVALPIALLLLPWMATSAGATTFSCTGVMSGTINGSVNVPTGGICALDGATVKGGVNVSQGGGLLITNGSLITGSVLSVSGPAANFHPQNTFGNSSYPSYNGSVWVCGSTVVGSVNVAKASNQLTIGAPPAGGRFFDQFNNCAGSTIGGSIIASGVQGGVEVVNDSIGGTVQITKTVGCPNDEDGCNSGPPPTPPSVEVTGDSIHGSLLCSSSQNGVDVHDNTVRGSTNCT